MDLIKDGWFCEQYCANPTQRFCLRVEEVLFHQKSEYQDILIFKSFDVGNVLVIDGVIQCTEIDEFSYQEMLAHLPLTVHPNPRKVLVVGGGDGGVVREVVKHPEVEEVHLCELDEVVLNAARKYLPYMSVGLNSEKLTIHVRDGMAFMKEHKKEFDVIITDSSDPEVSSTPGPAAALFQQQYYELLKESLNDKGIICSQGEGIWLDLGTVLNMRRFCRRIFPVVAYAQASVPTYSSGVIGFCVCCLDPSIDVTKPTKLLDPDEYKLRYYNKDVHTASFVLPEFARKALADCEDDQNSPKPNGDS